MRNVTVWLLFATSVLHHAYSIDYCDITCAGVPNCISSYCMDWKVPAVCHGIQVRSDGSLCSASDGLQNCRGSVLKCDTVTPSPPKVTTGPNHVTTSTTTSGTTAVTSKATPSFDDLRGSWCNTYTGIDPEDLWTVDFLTFHDNGDLLIQSRGVAFIMQYLWEGNVMYVYNVRSEGGEDPGFSSLRFFYAVADEVGQLTGYSPVNPVGVFYPTEVKTVCGPVITRFPSSTTTSTTPSGPTDTPTEDGLAGTWCGQPDDTFDSIGFSGNTLAVLYNGEIYYMQYYWESNMIYTYGADPVREAEASVDFSALQLSYFVSNISIHLAGDYIGTYRRDGICGPLPGIEGVKPRWQPSPILHGAWMMAASSRRSRLDSPSPI